MPILKKIEQCLASQIPFVAYLKPNELTCNLLAQKDADLKLFSGQSGFVFFPFDKGDKVVIPFDEADFSQGIIEKKHYNLVSDISSSQKDKVVFEQLVSNGIEAIKKGEFEKVVISRKIVLKEQLSVLETFQNLISTYPSAFRYLFFHPKIGLWMGATPEQLVKINQQQVETVALAGTKLYSEEVKWTQKEIIEQKIVTDYIVSNIDKKVENIKVSGPNTTKAGNLAHLKSVITGQLPSDNFAMTLIENLHPTPAVCGVPKNVAQSFIHNHEGYDRKYYAGFLGEYTKAESTDLFVNLRCMEIEDKATTIYVGCGITADSNPTNEYIETENKSMTMRNVLVTK